MNYFGPYLCYLVIVCITVVYCL